MRTLARVGAFLLTAVGIRQPAHHVPHYSAQDLERMARAKADRERELRLRQVLQHVEGTDWFTQRLNRSFQQPQQGGEERE